MLFSSQSTQHTRHRASEGGQTTQNADDAVVMDGCARRMAGDPAARELLFWDRDDENVFYELDNLGPSCSDAIEEVAAAEAEAAAEYLREEHVDCVVLPFERKKLVYLLNQIKLIYWM